MKISVSIPILLTCAIFCTLIEGSCMTTNLTTRMLHLSAESVRNDVAIHLGPINQSQQRRGCFELVRVTNTDVIEREGAGIRVDCESGVADSDPKSAAAS
jgi:hypothetical protein